MNQIRYDGPVTIAVGESRRSTQWKNKEVLWSQLVERLSIPTKTPETVDEYRGFAKSKRDEIKDVGGFVGGSLKGGRRKAEAIMQRRLLTLDLDDVPRNADPWDTVVLVLGCAAVLYSTHSHRPEAPRLRLVMPLSRPVSPEEYSAIARKVAQDIGIDMCDDTTYEPHRLMSTFWIFFQEANADAISLLSQPRISIGQMTLLAYSEKAPRSPSDIFPPITRKPPTITTASSIIFPKKEIAG